MGDQQHCESPPWYPALVDWIKGVGGHVHESLVLTHQDGIRGIACRNDIAKGELLIRLPASLALSGESTPLTYDSKHASPWLQCLAALYQAHNKEDSRYQSYLDSLPDEYEHLFQWTDQQVDEHLQGTTLGTMVKEDRSQHTLEQRFLSSVQPYLAHTGALSSSSSLQNGEKLQEQFRHLCMVLSTRGFHLHSTTSSADDNTDTQPQQQTYSGPFLLPFVDLLNHNPVRACTTLKRDDETGTFYMIAQRNIDSGEQVFHSYGNDLSSAQCLQTFGFVPEESIQRAAASTWNDAKPVNDCSNGCCEVTAAMLSRNDIVKACREMAESAYPQQVQTRTEIHRDGQDETWDVKAMDYSSRKIDFVPNDLAISYCDTPLSNEVVTLCTLLLLPEEAYDDFMSDSPTLLDLTILQDYFLGKLVCRSLLTAIDHKKSAYGSDIQSNATKLNEYIKCEKKTIADLRAMYGLTIRIEEMTCLEKLRKQVLELMDSLDDDDEADDEGVNGAASSGKRKRDSD